MLITMAPDVYLIPLLPQYALNVYLVNGILIDAGTRFHTWYLRRILQELPLRAHVLTHVHPDHQGASHALCTAFNLPLWCGAPDAAAMEQGTMQAQFPPGSPHAWYTRLAGPPHPVTRRLQPGDRVGDLTVIATPGHTPGHLSLWRAADRLLILGDVLSHTSVLTTRGRLHEPPAWWSVDPARNRQSARHVAALQPATILFGHGPPLRDGSRCAAWVAQHLASRP
jgi:glyoxylase-like metal-dependent hydrolase (beta-lactamase superfamily II)